jgi:hypothetical protein
MTPAQGTAWAGRRKAIAGAGQEGTVLKKTLLPLLPPTLVSGFELPGLSLAARKRCAAF